MSLIFKLKLDTNTQVLFIDSRARKSQLFFDSTNNKTFPIIYDSKATTGVELLDLLKNNFSNIERIAFVFEDPKNLLKNFVDSKPFFNYNDVYPILNEDIIGNEVVSSIPNHSNYDLIASLIKDYNVKNIDFLACNSLNEDLWKSFYDKLHKDTDVIVGASNDNTGNLNLGADWIMESTQEDIRNVYFNSTISNYESYLGSNPITIPYSTSVLIKDTLTLDSSGNNIIAYSIDGGVNYTNINNSTQWPVTIQNAGSTTVTVTFVNNLILNSENDQFFIMGNDNITVNGDNHTVTIDGISNYPGLIQNGTSSSDGKNNITIEYIGVLTSNGSTLVEEGGWVCQSFFSTNATNNNVNNCYSTGSIENNSGGILGYIAGAGYQSSVTISVLNCYSMGTIGFGCGGIFGSLAGLTSSGTINISNCYSMGTIGKAAGGIFGRSAGILSSGTINISNCYSTGNMVDSGGGIFGDGAGYESSVKINVSNCYSTGTIGQTAGGIFGIQAGDGLFQSFLGRISVSNCYSTGTIGQNAGGIFGSQTGLTRFSGSIIVSNCYTTGSILDATSGGIFGSDSNSNCRVTNSVCNIRYSNNTTINNNASNSTANVTNLSWEDSTANSILISTGTEGSIWTDIDINSTTTPYLLSAFNGQIYNPPTASTSLTNYTTNNGTYSTSYKLISVNNILSSDYSINNLGAITFQNLEKNNEYEALVLSYLTTTDNQYYDYNINTFTLNVGTEVMITVQPSSQTVYVGSSVSFEVRASGTDPITYDWYHEGFSLGVHTNTYTIDSVENSDEGVYYVIVSNDYGSETSNNATLTVKSSIPIKGVKGAQGLQGNTGESAKSVIQSCSEIPPYDYLYNKLFNQLYEQMYTQFYDDNYNKFESELYDNLYTEISTEFENMPYSSERGPTGDTGSKGTKGAKGANSIKYIKCSNCEDVNCNYYDNIYDRLYISLYDTLYNNINNLLYNQLYEQEYNQLYLQLFWELYKNLDIQGPYGYRGKTGSQGETGEKGEVVEVCYVCVNKDLTYVQLYEKLYEQLYYQLYDQLYNNLYGVLYNNLYPELYNRLADNL
jgi:hypothetical protein